MEAFKRPMGTSAALDRAAGVLTGGDRPTCNGSRSISRWDDMQVEGLHQPMRTSAALVPTGGDRPIRKRPMGTSAALWFFQ
jgi:hypothetical protein